MYLNSSGRRWAEFLEGEILHDPLRKGSTSLLWQVCSTRCPFGSSSGFIQVCDETKGQTYTSISFINVQVDQSIGDKRE